MVKLSIKDNVFVDRENEKLEYKSASKGLPRSLWESYSSFANTFGGKIILGVCDDGKIEGVPNAEQRIKEIWDSLNNSQVVNRNILCSDDIWLRDCDGKQLIVINVPRANRFLRPVFYKNMETGTFKRCGEGDYHCTMSEISSMLRDQSATSYDSTLLEKSSFDDIDLDSLRAYRQELKTVQPDHMWNKCDNKDFARKIGVVGHSVEELTVAGLLMFGKEEAIQSYFPRFKLDYMECPEKNTFWNYRRVTGDGLWVGNVYNFFLLVRGRIGTDVNQPLELDANMHRVIDTDVHKALREGLVNCLMHADYFGNLVVKIEKYPKKIIMVNSGTFRIPLEIAEKGGESDPRNAIIAKMFSLIGFSERAGIGINFMIDTWINRFGNAPQIIEDATMQRTLVNFSLSVRKKTDSLDEKILKLIENNQNKTIDDMAKELNVSRPTVANRLKTLKLKGIVVRVGGTRGHWELVS